MNHCSRCHRETIVTYEAGDGRRVCFGCISHALREADRRLFWERWRVVTTRPPRIDPQF